MVGQGRTRANYENIYNVPGRTIVGLDNFSPTYHRLQEKPDDAEGLPPWRERLPDINSWSDVVWIIWAEQAKKAGG